MENTSLPSTDEVDEVHHEGDRANPRKLGYVGSLDRSSRDSDAWFTPGKYLIAARRVLGGYISLDPFSSPEANQIVQAERFLTEKDDAFKTEWFPKSRSGEEAPRTVWMNPPYGAGLVSDAMNLFLNEFSRGTFDEGLLLVNNATETKWFQRALSVASGLTLTNHRISFWNSDGKAVSGNTRGQAFLYFGPHTKRYMEEFSEFGFSCPLPSDAAARTSEESMQSLPLDF